MSDEQKIPKRQQPYKMPSSQETHSAKPKKNPMVINKGNVAINIGNLNLNGGNFVIQDDNTTIKQTLTPKKAKK